MTSSLLIPISAPDPLVLTLGTFLASSPALPKALHRLWPIIAPPPKPPVPPPKPLVLRPGEPDVTHAQPISASSTVHCSTTIRPIPLDLALSPRPGPKHAQPPLPPPRQSPSPRLAFRLLRPQSRVTPRSVPPSFVSMIWRIFSTMATATPPPRLLADSWQWPYDCCQPGTAAATPRSTAASCGKSPSPGRAADSRSSTPPGSSYGWHTCVLLSEAPTTGKADHKTPSRPALSQANDGPPWCEQEGPPTSDPGAPGQ